MKFRAGDAGLPTVYEAIVTRVLLCNRIDSVHVDMAIGRYAIRHHPC